ncbi:MAG: epsH 2 [Verrucomicrobia bacterium]|nr:epsH 2 [Verrucomicrobiota bacterium]
MVFHRDTPHLRPAIASVLGQTFRDLELVLVDNGTGLPPQTLGPLGDDRRIRWVRLPRNEGIPTGHNAGVAAAAGGFCALLDYDDLALPGRIEAQVTALRADPNLALVSSFAEKMDEMGRPIGRVFCLPDAEDHLPYSLYAAPVITPAAMGRREVFLSHPYRPAFPFAADLDFQSRLAEHACMGVLREVHVKYRVYRTQTTQDKSSAIVRSRCIISLLAARRRNGRREGLDDLITLGGSMSAAAFCAHLCGLASAEGFAELAAYFARRMLALQRSPITAIKSLRLFATARKQAAPADRKNITRMYLSGPVRALGVGPA